MRQDGRLDRTFLLSVHSVHFVLNLNYFNGAGCCNGKPLELYPGGTRFESSSCNTSCPDSFFFFVTFLSVEETPILCLEIGCDCLPSLPFHQS
jgi:hypothetical protein